MRSKGREIEEDRRIELRKEYEIKRQNRKKKLY